MNEARKSYEDPFVILRNADILWLMRHVKPTSINVYLALLVRANRKRANSCFPSLARIADEANVSRRTVISAVQELEAAGIVTVERRVDAEGDATSNLYLIHRPESAELAGGGETDAPRVGENLHHQVGQNLPPNHMNTLEPDEGEPDGGADAPPTRDSQKSRQFSGKRKTQVPEGWRPSIHTFPWCYGEGFTNEDIEREVPKFIDHHRAKGNTFVNIDLAFKNWMRGSTRFSGGGGGGRPAQTARERQRAELDDWARREGIIADDALETSGRIR